jgi:hypothetical protein
MAGRFTADGFLLQRATPMLSEYDEHGTYLENKRIQIFDSEGTFLKEWTDIGYPYGLFITPDQHVWMIDGGYDRLIELDQDGRILGAAGRPERAFQRTEILPPAQQPLRTRQVVSGPLFGAIGREGPAGWGMTS